MRLSLLSLLLIGSAQAALRASITIPPAGTGQQARTFADLPCSTIIPQAASEPVSLRSLQQQLQLVQGKVDRMSLDVTATKQKVEQSSRQLDQLMRYFIKTSCDDVTLAPADPLVLPTAPSASASARPDVGRQHSMEGVYAIFPPTGTPKRVKCDHISSGDPGWTVVLLRTDGSLDFNRTLEEYRTGFGDPAGEVWIGLDTLHVLTSSRPQQLRVELRDFAGNFAYAHYADFSVGAAAGQYRLSVGGYDSKSTAGDGLKDHNGMLFSTIDMDNDNDAGNSCASQFGGGGGWWYARCYHVLGTGQYRRPANKARPQVTQAYGGVTWHPFSDVKQSLQHFKMLIKAKEL